MSPVTLRDEEQNTSSPSITTPSPRGRALTTVVLALLIGLGLVRILSTYHVFNHTIDEGAHLACGIQWFEHIYTYDQKHTPIARISIAPYAAVKPRVAGMNNSAVKGGDPSAFRTRNRLSALGLWQLHASRISDAANTSDVASHMPAQTMDLYTIVYTQMQPMTRNSEREAVDMSQLRALSRSGGAISPGERDKLLSAIEALRTDDLLIWQVAGWTLPKLRELGSLDAGRVNDMLAAARRHYGDCIRPLPGNFPGHGPDAPV